MQRLSLLDAIIHASLARSALLMSLVFLKPRPLLYFGMQSFSHYLQARNFPSWSFGFHQNLLIMESILSQTLSRTLKVDMVQVEMDWATEFIRASLPAQKRHLLLQHDILASSLSWRKEKSLEGVLDRNIGAPRQTTFFLSFLIWRMPLMEEECAQRNIHQTYCY